jgi:hypothetical protein
MRTAPPHSAGTRTTLTALFNSPKACRKTNTAPCRATEAVSPDLGIAELVGQILAAVIKKDMIKEMLRDKAPAA